MRLFPSLLALLLACAACSSSDPCSKDPAACADAGPGSCMGVCLPQAPAAWYAVSLLWIGASNATPPACPSELSLAGPGFAETPPTVSCPSCMCSPSIAACNLPDQLAANASTCLGGSGSQQFNAPPAWDGT